MHLTLCQLEGDFVPDTGGLNRISIDNLRLVFKLRRCLFGGTVKHTVWAVNTHFFTTRILHSSTILDTDRVSYCTLSGDGKYNNRPTSQASL